MKENKKAPLFTEIVAKEAASINGGCEAQCVHSRQNVAKLGSRGK
ncbi:MULTISPECIES: hypothetical protein [Aerosakkonema]